MNSNLETQIDIGKNTKITCRKPTQVEIYIHSMMNLLYDGPQKKLFLGPLKLSLDKVDDSPNFSKLANLWLQRNGFNNDV